MDPSACVVLVPVASRVEPDCEAALRELERLGHPVRRVYGYAAVDVARSQMATDALGDGFDELLWVDADIAFDPAAVARLRSHGVPVAAGVYPKKGKRELAVSFLPGTREVVLGAGGGPVEVRYVGLGFCLTHRTVYEAVERHHRLPVCNQRFGRPLVPYFAPLAADDGGGWWYLAEDYAFCHRARQAGVPIRVDTSVRLWHLGSYPYTWEDAGRERAVYETFVYHLGPDGSEPAARGGRPSNPRL